jgi:hypothetical protein
MSIVIFLMFFIQKLTTGSPLFLYRRSHQGFVAADVGKSEELKRKRKRNADLYKHS